MFEQEISKAEEWVGKALERNPHRVPLLLSKCVIAASKGDLEGGMADCRKARELTSNKDMLAGTI